MKTRFIRILLPSFIVVTLGNLLNAQDKESVNNFDTTQVINTIDTTLLAERIFNLIILDESGSMSDLKEVAVAGVNETFQTIRLAYEEFPQQEQFVTFATFSGNPYYQENTCRVKRERQHIDGVTDLELIEYNPDDLTPLWDTMGKLLCELEECVNEEDLVLVTIITDGYENSSVKYDAKIIKKLVSRLDEKGWIFTYIGANQDVFKVATEMGIRNYYLYVSDKENTKRMFARERKFRLRFYKSSRYWEQSEASKEDLRKKLQEGYFEEGNED